MFLYSNTIGYSLSDLVAVEYELTGDAESDAESKKLDKLKKDKHAPSLAFALFRDRETQQHPDLDLFFDPQVLVSIPTPPPES